MRLLRPSDVCELLGVSLQTLNRLRDREDFPLARRIGGRAIGFVEEEVVEWVEGRPRVGEGRDE
jgi:predicted DNA-binding transcriptional regulator AlpA